MNKIFCDILISGAGIIGSTLALRLVQFGFQVIVIDSTVPIIFSKKYQPDLRVSAINISSVHLLKEINVWKKIKSSFCVPFKKLEVWEYLSSKVIFDSSLLNLPNMGLIVENNRLQSALWENFLDCAQLTFYHSSFLTSMYYNGEYWEVKLNNKKKIISLLLVGADGKNSLVRTKAGIKVSGWKYRQLCMLFSITYTRDQKSTIWQAFTPFGPRGFLPLYNNWGSLMWYDDINYIHKLQQLPTLLLEKKIEKEFGSQLGNIKIYKNIYFPLLRQHAHTYIKEGLVLIGDAAHTINPLAGQGINLGLRDVDMLVNILTTAKNHGIAWNKLKILKKYQNTRWFDNFLMQSAIDSIYTIFSNDILCIKKTRNISLMCFEKLPLLKKCILRYALGYKYGLSKFILFSKKKRE